MQIIERTPTRLVIGGWNTGKIDFAGAILAAPVVISLQTGWQEPWKM